MNSKLFIKASRPSHKYHNKKTSYEIGNGISKVIATTPFEDLKQLVIDNFEFILDASKPEEYICFTMYTSWKRLFCGNYLLAFEAVDNLCDFEKIIEAFPTLESSVYDYLFKECVISQTPSFDVDIAEDLLIPMAYLERYRGCYFPQVRKYIKRILEATTTYMDFFNTIAVLENDFDIPEDTLEPLIKIILNEEINNWNTQVRSLEEASLLIEFFYSKDAYDLFMENLPDILQRYGIALYAKLIEYAGPVGEILCNQSQCYEFNKA